MARTTIHSSDISDGAITSADLDTNIAIDGDLTVDTDTLYVDSTNNRVGIGTSSPTKQLEVSGTDARIYLSGNDTDISMDNNGNGHLKLDGNGYAFGIALDASGANLYTNSSVRSLIFGTNETERMRIDSSGRVTMPYQPAFYARGGNTQSWSGTANYQILQLDISSSFGNHSGGYNTSTYTYTAPVAGLYLIMGRMTQTTYATGPSMGLYRNGSFVNHEICISYGNNYLTTSGFMLVELAANDSINLRVINYNNTSITLDLSRCAFSGWLVG